MTPGRRRVRRDREPAGSARPPSSAAAGASATCAVLLALAAGCAGGDADARRGAGEDSSATRPAGSGGAGAVADSPGAAPDGSTASADPRRDGSAGSIPPQVYVDSGACPYECCIYREWLAQDSVPAYTREAGPSRVAFVLQAGERFEALTGNVHLDPTGMALIRRELVDAFGNPAPRFAVGDTLYVLSYQGEGVFNVWYRGERTSMEACWGPAFGPDASEPACELLREPVPRWWVHARNAEGDDGWIDMKAHGEVIGQRDACG